MEEIEPNTKCELAVYLTMIEPPGEDMDEALVEVMKRLPPTDYLFAKRTLDVIGGTLDPKQREYFTRCLCAALWGNPLAMCVLELDCLKNIVRGPHPPSDLFAYWNERRRATGFAELCWMNVVDKMKLIACAYLNHDAEPRHGEKKRWHHARSVVEELKAWGFTKENDPIVLAVGYGQLLFAETKMTVRKLGAFAETGEEIDEMSEVASLIKQCEKSYPLKSDSPDAVVAVRLADVVCEIRKCQENEEGGEALRLQVESRQLVEIARSRPWGKSVRIED